MQEPKVLKYWTLVEHLRKQIGEGRLQPGGRVPSLAEMQAQFHVSRATVEKAYTLLEQDGLVVREQGRGTFVAERSSSRITGKLGLVLHVNSLTSFYMMGLLAGVHREASRRNLELLWLDDEDVIGGKKVDAVLMCCHPTEALALKLPARVPHALLFQHSPDFTCVAADDFDGVKSATQHLLELGHRRIAYLPASSHDSISCRRLAGYRAALAEADLPVDETLIKFLLERRQYNYRHSGEVAMQSWLEADWRELDCTAILAHNDEAAIGVIKVLREHGLCVPDDVSVVGFDGTELSELSTPALTTIKVPLQEIGAAAVKVLAAQMKGGVSPEPQKIVLPVQLKPSESTAVLKPRSEQFCPALALKE